MRSHSVVLVPATLLLTCLMLQSAPARAQFGISRSFLEHQIKNVQPLAALTQPEVLDLSYSEIVDGSPLANPKAQMALEDNPMPIDPRASLPGLVVGQTSVGQTSSEPTTGQAASNIVNSFQDWCENRATLTPAARLTVDVLLGQTGTEDCAEAESVLLATEELYLSLSEANLLDIFAGVSPTTSSDETSGPSDLGPLMSLPQLKRLTLTNGNIQDLTPLTQLTQLEELNLVNTQTRDIGSLAGLKNLRSLTLLEIPLSDLEVVRSLPNLTHLQLERLPVTDLSPLSSATGLESLDLSIPPINDLAPLSTLTRLKYLNLGAQPLPDLSFIVPLTQLEILNLDGTGTTDLTPLAGLTRLTRLSLFLNQITDVRPLAGLTNLRELMLVDNQIQDASPLSSLTQLEMLDLAANPLRDRTCPVKPDSICQF
ncbi:MAG TPA: leucine-rich repeat domain-containing protein [Leptolyngbyaceae cyanobacterium]